MYTKYLFPLFFAVLAASGSSNDLYEGFDFGAKKSVQLSSSDSSRSGESSSGWHSTWHVSSGKAVTAKSDLEIEGLESASGSVEIRGERKPNSIGQGVAIRQMNLSFKGDVYGSFRFKSGKLLNDSAIGLLFALPSSEPITPRNATFAFCPKRWGSSYGVMGAGAQRLEKIQSGEACQQDETYLVLWKLGNLPEAGMRQDIELKMWVLNEAQAAHFAAKGFASAGLAQAETGSEADQVSQMADRKVRDSKRGLFRGTVISCFSVGTPRVVFDEIRVSADGFPAVAGLSSSAL